MHETLTQKEFIDKYNAGQREFSDVLMQFFDVSNAKLSDIEIRNSKIMFCNFHDCTLSNVKLENCNIFFFSFYTGTASNVLFEKCDVEQMLFDSFSFNNTKLVKCNIRWSGIFNSNSNSVDISSSTTHKFFTDISQLTSSDMDEAVRIIMHDIERLDLSTRLKVKEMIRQDIDRYKLPEPGQHRKEYENRPADDSPLTYSEIRGVLQAAYGKPQNYKEKTSYEREPYK
jgi:hypothetical protein